MEKAFFSRIHSFQHTSYADIVGMRENGYEGMTPVQEKTPTSESGLNGRAYAAAGQTVASLHTMAVLQAYQTDLLKRPG